MTDPDAAQPGTAERGPVPVGVTRIAIRSVSEPAALPAAPAAGNGGGYPRPYANTLRNSRIDRPLPGGLWRPKWSVDLDPELGASFTLQEGDRVVLPGTYQWVLYGMDGRVLKKGPMGGREAVLDPAHALFYAPDPAAMIAAYQLNDGMRAFAINGYPGAGSMPAFIVRQGRLLLDVSPTTTARPHAAAIVSETGLQVLDVGDRQDVDESGILENATVVARATLPAFRVPVALVNGTLVLALENRIQLADLRLQVRSELTGEFQPRALSVDEAGRMYLIVRAQGEHQLWVITPEGERMMAVPLPSADVATPPIVGHDHRVYLVGAGHVSAISPTGRTLWDRSLGGRIAGAVVTADGRLVVSAAPHLVSFEPDGTAILLYSFDGEHLQTPPVLTAGGDLLVASQQRLHALVGTAPPP